MNERRREGLSYRCAWCNRIWTGMRWINEARSGLGTRYSHGICDACGVVHMAEGLPRFRNWTRLANGAAARDWTGKERGSRL